MHSLNLFFSDLNQIPTARLTDYYLFYTEQQGPYLQDKTSLRSCLGTFIYRLPCARHAISCCVRERKINRVVREIISAVEDHKVQRNHLKKYITGLYKLSVISESVLHKKQKNSAPLLEQIHTLALQLIIREGENTATDPATLAYTMGFTDLAYHLMQSTSTEYSKEEANSNRSDLLFYCVDQEHIKNSDRIPFPESVDNTYSIDDLKLLFQKVNLDDPMQPHYILQEEYADDNPSMTSQELQKSLITFIERVKNRVSYVGTPGLMHDLENFYNTIEIAVTHTLSYLLQQPESEKKQELIKIIFLIFIKAAPHCGGRIFSASIQAYKTVMRGRPLAFEEEIFELLEEQRELLLQNFSGNETHNIHHYNYLLRNLGESLGITGTDAMQHFDDHLGQEFPQLATIWDHFHMQYTPHTIINHWFKPLLESNGALRERFYDWIKEHIPHDWKREWFDKLHNDVSRLDCRKDQEKYLHTYEIFLAPNQTAAEAIDNERITQFLAEEVIQDMKSEKIEIKAGAIAFLLEELHVIKKLPPEKKLQSPIPKPPLHIFNNKRNSHFEEAAEYYFYTMHGDLSG